MQGIGMGFCDTEYIGVCSGLLTWYDADVSMVVKHDM